MARGCSGSAERIRRRARRVAAESVVADNLNNPRGVAIGPDGGVYVAGAGTAGPTCSGTGDATTCVALCGPVTRVAMSAGECAQLPAGVPAAARAQIGRLLKAGPKGVLGRVANIAAVECRTNPDGQDRNGNPYTVPALGKGREIVVDVGANTLVSVKGRRAGTLAVFRLRRAAGSSPPRSRSAPTAPTTSAASTRAAARAARGSSAWSSASASCSSRRAPPWRPTATCTSPTGASCPARRPRPVHSGSSVRGRPGGAGAILPPMADLDELTTMIEAALPGTSAQVVDQGGGDHLAASVVAPQFDGLSRLEQHKLVYAAVQSRFDDGSIHALALKTRVPEAT